MGRGVGVAAAGNRMGAVALVAFGFVDAGNAGHFADDLGIAFVVIALVIVIAADIAGLLGAFPLFLDRRE